MPVPREPLDSYLLRVLHIVLEERSVTRAAVRLNQSQPAISGALRRLRELIGDPLLVRGKLGMVPTEHGQWLVEPVRAALAEIDRIRFKQPQFDPLRSQRVFRIGSPDYLNALFLPGIVERFRARAPAAALEFVPLGQGFDYELALERGALDVVIGNWPEPPEQLRLSQLLSDEIVCLMSASHRFARRGRISYEQYLEATHLAPAPYSVGQRGVIDRHLARERVVRRVAVTLPYFNLAPQALVNSDLIFTTARRFAEHFAGVLPLAVLPAPLDFPAMPYYQLWHERAHESAEVRWLRALISEAVLAAAPRGGGAA